VFTSLYHHVADIDHLRQCYRELKGDKALGIDGVSKEMYAKDLEANLQDLSARLKRMGYRPQPAYSGHSDHWFRSKLIAGFGAS